jgi:hypothetical protein
MNTLLNSLIQVVPRLLHLRQSIVLVLFSLRVIHAVVRQAEKCEVILGAVSRVLIEMRYLPMLLGEVATDMKPKGTTPSAPVQDQ